MGRIYLVTGAAGFLGSNVCAQLLEKGEKVRALVLPNDKSVRFIPKDVEICLGDLCDEASLEEFFTIPEGDSSVIIHCASMVTVDPVYSEKLMEVNVTGTRNVITKVFKNLNAEDIRDSVEVFDAIDCECLGLFELHVTMCLYLSIHS